MLLEDDNDLTLWVDSAGKVRPASLKARAGGLNGYVDGAGKLWVALSDSSGATQVVDADTGAVGIQLVRAYPIVDHNRRRGPDRQWLPPYLGFTNADSVAVGPDGSLGVLRVPSGNEPSTIEEPALLLSPGSEPVALAPWSWSTLELASSSACKQSQDGYRALVQTSSAWLTADPAARHIAGMSAIVRWSRDRICLEAIETPYGSAHESFEPLLVGRFVGADAGTAVVAISADVESRQMMDCQLSSVP